jgi:hypothetical protein
MKVNKVLLIVLGLFALISIVKSEGEKFNPEDLAQLEEMMKNGTFTNTTAEEAADETEEQIRETIKQMGLDQSETITREKFKEFFSKLILQGEEVPQDEKEIFDKLIERVAAKAPETFPTKDISKYVEMQEITNILNEIMAESGIDPKAAMEEFGNVMGEDGEEGDHDHHDHDHDHEHAAEEPAAEEIKGDL